MTVVGQQQGAGHQRFAEFGQQCLGDEVIRDADADRLLPGVQQPPGDLLGGGQDERVTAGSRRLDLAEQRVAQVYELAELGEVTAYEGEVVVAAEAADLLDPVEALLVARPASQGVAGVGGVGDEPVRPQDLGDLADQARLGVAIGADRTRLT
ncbi:hypothetical protein PW035_60115 [Nonomuraea angiospora]|nr:hypothetical protein [Nonomuraea angiospora]